MSLNFRLFFILSVSFLSSSLVIAQRENCCPVHVIGAMRHVMWDGQLYGTIHLDTITNKNHLYGLGPMEYLAGELLILDGKSYVSRVISETEMTVEETYDVKAPFFVYANVEKWKAKRLSAGIQNLAQLETYLDKKTRNVARPFAFKLTGIVDSASIHIVNLPTGMPVRSPADAHQRSTEYQLRNQEVIIVGFFSTQHQAVFTHHDTYLHLHLITEDKMQMGHLDEVIFRQGDVKLHLPKK